MFAGNYEAVPLVTFIEWLGKWIVESLMKIMIAESSLSTFFIQPYWLLRKQDLDFFCFFFFFISCINASKEEAYFTKL
jgi:hypothetical protein